MLLVAGLLQDIGQLVLASRAASAFAMALSRSESQKQPLFEIERDSFGASHAEVGAYLLGLWGLPQRVVTAVANHLQPQLAASRVFDAAAALYVANHLLADPGVPAVEDVPPHTVALDLAYLQRIGVAHHLDEWRRLALAFGTGSVPASNLVARA